VSDAAAVPNPFAGIVEELRAQRALLDATDWTIPEPPADGPTHYDYRLKPREQSDLKALSKPMTVEMLRNTFNVKLHDYLGGDSDAALLVAMPPGTGKTHTTVAVAQFLARHGQRGLWAASRHNMFDDLSGFPHFDPSLWYHWTGIQGQQNDAPVCKHADAQRKWSNLGYKSSALCLQLCKHDGYIGQCPYRQQAKRKEPLIFGQHQHLVSGLSISNFDFVIVDELPLNAFVNERLIPADGLDVNARGPLKLLTDALRLACFDAPKMRRISGRELFDRIGLILNEAYAQIDLGIGLPEVPDVYSPDQVHKLPYWYLFDFLRLAQAEHRAWEERWPTWNERVWITRGGLHLLSRSEPWDKLPRKTVVLDATAQPDLYQLVLKRDVEVFAPTVERVGKLYQIAGRLNGKHTTLDKGELSDSGRELLDITRRLIAQRGYTKPGFVVWKALATHFQREFGDAAVLTFGGLRGTNALQDVDALFICGTYTPNGFALIDHAVALSDRVEPLFQLGEDGRKIPLYRYADREYRLTPYGLDSVKTQFGSQYNAVTRRTGYYAEPTLDAVHRQLREAELVQALHRARINVRQADAWLLTSTPTDEPLDGVWNDPPLGPDGIEWRVWLRIEAWLEEQAKRDGQITITYDDLAQVVVPRLRKDKDTNELAYHDKGLSSEYMRKNKWLELIAGHLSEDWQLEKLTVSAKGGRPKTVLVNFSKGGFRTF